MDHQEDDPDPTEAQAAGAALDQEDTLVQRAQARDFSAFEALVKLHQDRIYRLAVRMTGNPTDAQEVVQEALLSAWKNLPRFESKSQFGSWLYRIAANSALMLLRTKRRHPHISVEGLAPGIVDGLVEDAAPGMLGMQGAGDDWTKRPDEQFQSAELREQIQLAVDNLPAGAREVFIVRDLEGLSTEETAEVLGLSPAAVKTRLHRARLALREAISAYFGDRT